MANRRTYMFRVEGPGRPARTHIRKTRPAARAAFRALVYTAYFNDSRLDSLAAHTDCATAENWDCESAVVLKIGPYEIEATASVRLSS